MRKIAAFMSAGVLCITAVFAGNEATRSPSGNELMRMESKAWTEALIPAGKVKAVLAMKMDVDAWTGIEESRVERARKITLTYPAIEGAAGSDGAWNDAENDKTTGTETLRKQETWFPTVHTRRRAVDSRFENAVFNVGLAYMMALNAADYVTTREALKHEDLMEANPLMQPFVKNPYAFAAVKAGLGLSSYFIMKSLYRKNKVLAWAVNVAANAALSYVVINNLKMIRSVEQRSACR